MTAATLAARQRAIWDRIAPFWSAHRDATPELQIEWTPRLPDVEVAGTRILELGCGDGRRAVELAAAGADVATDASPVFVNLASARADRDARDLGDRFSTAVIDATDGASLAEIDGTFDLVIADMVLMNLVDLEPLAIALPRLIRRGGRFTPTVLHPCFASPFFVDIDDSGRPAGAISRLVGAGQRIGTYIPKRALVAVSRLVRPLLARPRPYIPTLARRVAVPGQPEPHFNIHRSIGTLLQPFFEAGLILHGLSEGSSKERIEPGVLWLDLRTSSHT